MEKLQEFKPEHSSYEWKIHDLGLIKYEKALEIQESTRQEVIDGGQHTLFLLEHPSVITLGRRTDPKHLVWSEDDILNAGIEIFRVDRGGSATFHGPGQLVGYLICKSSRMGGIHTLVSKILIAIRETMITFGIDVYIDEENPGIWTNTELPRKLAAVGMSNTKGYTMHGFAMNVDMPLTGFNAIVPCGLTLPVTTMAIETGKRIEIDKIKKEMIEQIKTSFNTIQ